MKRPNVVLMLCSLLIVTGSATAGEEVPSGAGQIARVTVYRGQALVTRRIDIDLPEGSSEFIVTQLPANVISESIYAQAADQTEVMSVRYRERAVQEDTREEVRQLDRQIETVEHDLKYAQSELDHARQQWQMFEKLKEFAITAAQGDLNRGLLTFDPLQSLTELIETKGHEYLEQQLKLEDQIAAFQKEKDLLARRRTELTAGRSRTEREALLFLRRGPERRVSLELSYLVEDANWQQQYNLRAGPDAGKVVIEYNAVVNQTSGEDWNAVALSLSTAVPTMVAAAPVLDPMLVGLAPQAQVQQPIAPPQVAFDQLRQFQQSRKDYVTQGKAANLRLNELAVENQAFFLNAGEREVEQYQRQMAEVLRTEGVSVTYALPGRLTLPSRSDQQLVTIATIDAAADFRLVATPLLTDYVYLQADVTNASETILLPGPASMFRNGEFVGRSQVPQVTIGEPFTAGFGIDSQIRVHHELEEKTTRIQGGNRIDTYNYRIALSNYKETAVDLRLLDRLPYTEDRSIKIELDAAQPPLSDDAEYHRTMRKKGVLRWDLELPAHTRDREATVVTYRYTMEYDRNMQIQPRRSSQ
jgi:uncharacterized protein (TIGR02231 family)